MENTKQEAFDFTKMVADYMEQGLLENIVSMFKSDRSYYPMIGKLIRDERMHVRIGVTALVEALQEEDSDGIALAVDSIIHSLGDPSPNVRGDAASLLGMIGAIEAIPYLQKLMLDEERTVRQMAVEAIEEINSLQSRQPSTIKKAAL